MNSRASFDCKERKNELICQEYEINYFARRYEIIVASTNSLGSHDLLKPKIVSLIKRDKVTKLGRELRVGCLLTGYPCRNIKWYMNGEQLSPTKDGRVYFETKGELVIQQLRKEDCGSLLIHAKNKYGEAYSSISLHTTPDEKCDSPKSRPRSKTYDTKLHQDRQLKRRLTTLFGKKSNR